MRIVILGITNEGRKSTLVPHRRGEKERGGEDLIAKNAHLQQKSSCKKGGEGPENLLVRVSRRGIQTKKGTKLWPNRTFLPTHERGFNRTSKKGLEHWLRKGEKEIQEIIVYRLQRVRGLEDLKSRARRRGRREGGEGGNLFGPKKHSLRSVGESSGRDGEGEGEGGKRIHLISSTEKEGEIIADGDAYSQAAGKKKEEGSQTEDEFMPCKGDCLTNQEKASGALSRKKKNQKASIRASRDRRTNLACNLQRKKRACNLSS